MTAVVVVGVVSWADQSSEAGGGQDVLDLMKSCAREKSVHVSRGILDGERWMGGEVTRVQAARRDILVSLFPDKGIFTHDIVVGAGRPEARTAT